MVSERGIKANPKTLEAVKEMVYPIYHKEV